MKPQSDKYDFTVSSGSNKPGFICFENKGQHLFHLNDEMGDCILYSQSYQSAKSRNNGIRSVKKNAPNPDRVETGKTDDGKFFYYLRAGNRQEIGRSGFFKKAEEMEAKLKNLAVVDESTPMHDMATSLVDKQKKTTKTIGKKKSKAPKKASESQKLPKYSFRIDWYPESNIGKIEHIVSGEAQQLTDLGKETIVNFINSYLPNTQSGTEKAPSPSKKVRPQEVIAPQVEEKTDIIGLKVGSEKVKGHLLPKASAVMVELNLKELIGKESKSCSATILAKSLKSFKEFPIGIIEGTPSSEGILSVPVFTQQFEPGTYRLTARVKTTDGQGNLTGSRVVQIW